MPLRVIIVEGNPRLVWKLMKRHNGRILAVALLLEVDNAKQAGAIARHYNANIAGEELARIINAYR